MLHSHSDNCATEVVDDGTMLLKLAKNHHWSLHTGHCRPNSGQCTPSSGQL